MGVFIWNKTVVFNCGSYSIVSYTRLLIFQFCCFGMFVVYNFWFTRVCYSKQISELFFPHLFCISIRWFIFLGWLLWPNSFYSYSIHTTMIVVNLCLQCCLTVALNSMRAYMCVCFNFFAFISSVPQMNQVLSWFCLQFFSWMIWIEQHVLECMWYLNNMCTPITQYLIVAIIAIAFRKIKKNWMNRKNFRYKSGATTFW